MRLRMLESVTGERGRLYRALDAGDTYELAPDYAQQLISSGKAVSVKEQPLAARLLPVGAWHPSRVVSE
jgi:hypothetical protein